MSFRELIVPAYIFAFGFASILGAPFIASIGGFFAVGLVIVAHGLSCCNETDDSITKEIVKVKIE
jgi:hypothetical protein